MAAPAVEAHKASQPIRGRGGQQHRHGAHHERSVAHRGQHQAVKLQKELDRNAEGRGQQHGAPLAGGQARAAAEHHGRHAQAGKEKTVEHHVLHVHLVEREPAPVEACAPEGSGQRACAVAQKPDLPARRTLCCHSFSTVAHAAARGFRPAHAAVR
jgi:hypothetical protein